MSSVFTHVIAFAAGAFSVVLFWIAASLCLFPGADGTDDAPGEDEGAVLPDLALARLGSTGAG